MMLIGATAQSKLHPVTVKMGTVVTIVILLLLTIAPSLHIFSKLIVFNAAGISITVGFLVLTAISGISLMLVLLGKITKIPSLLLLVIAFVGWGTIVALFQSVSIRWWLPPLLRWGGNILIAILGYHLTLRRYLTPYRFRFALIMALIVPLSIGIAELVLGLAPLLNGAYRVSGTFKGSPLGYSLFLSSAILMLLSVKRMTLFYKIVLSVSLLMVISTYSRLTLVALVVSAVFVLYFQRRFKIIFLFALLVLPFFMFMPFITEQIVTRFSGLSMANTNFSDIWREAQTMAYEERWWRPDIDSSSLLRVKTLVIGLKFWQQAPIQGNGFGSFVPNYEAATERANVAAHNDYLLYLVETGVVGLGMYIILQISIVVGLLKKIKDSTQNTRLFVVSVVGAYLAVNVLSFLSNSYYFYEVQLWIWMGIGVAFALINVDKSQVGIK